MKDWKGAQQAHREPCPSALCWSCFANLVVKDAHGIMSHAALLLCLDSQPFSPDTALISVGVGTVQKGAKRGGRFSHEGGKNMMAGPSTP